MSIDLDRAGMATEAEWPYPDSATKGVSVTVTCDVSVSDEPLTGHILDNGRVIDLETGEVVENPSWQQKADALRSKRICDGKFVTSRMARPGGKRMRGDDYGSNGLSDRELFYDKTVDDYEWPEIVVQNEADSRKDLRSKMAPQSAWDELDARMAGNYGRKPAFTKARSKDAIEVICGITFHYLNREIAYGVNSKGEAASYNFRTGKLLFTPSVNRAKKILAAIETRGAARVSRQTGIPVDVLQNWKKQGHCGGVLCVTALGVNAYARDDRRA